MSESADPRPVPKVARRTLIAGAAWAVPTVAVLSATPAFAASVPPPPTPAFSDVFVWQNNQPPTIQYNWSAFQLSYQLLQYKGTTTATVTPTVTVSPAVTGGWVAQFDNMPGGAYTATAGSSKDIQMQVHTGNYTQIPKGTYTITINFLVKPTTGTAYSVSYSWTYKAT